jgi:hypothetical protein
LMPSIINQNEKIYSGIVIASWSNTTTHEGIVFENDFVDSADEIIGDAEVIGVCCLVGGGVSRTIVRDA